MKAENVVKDPKKPIAIKLFINNVFPSSWLEKNDEAIAFFERVILNYPDSGSSILSEQELLKFKS
mgnify:CR=1 FL=1